MHPYKDATAPANMTLPVAEYPHLIGCSVTGGYVYRGAGAAGTAGRLLLRRLLQRAHLDAVPRPRRANGKSSRSCKPGYTITSFGDDEQGELYLVDYKGDVFRLARAE